MPAKRLPWFRFWIDATTHGKVRQLDDATFRTWVELLDAAAKQPRRGRFDSCAEAVSIVRRPAKHITSLITAKLIDETPQGLVMHDWDEWQRWRPEDANDDGSPTDHPPNGLANNSRTTPDQHVNGSAIRVPARAEVRAPASGDTDTDTETETEITPAPSEHPQGASKDDQGGIIFTDDERRIVNAAYQVLVPLGLSAEPRFWRKVLQQFAQLDLEAEALGMADWLRRHRKRVCSTAFVLNWLKTSAERRAEKIVPINGRMTQAEAEAEFGWMGRQSS